MVKLVEKLATIMTDDRIAEYLNESGHRTSENKLFTKASIKWIRYHFRIPGPKGGDGYTVKEAAEHFCVSTHVIYYWLNQGLLQGSKFAPGWPWKITFDDKTEKKLFEWVKQS